MIEGMLIEAASDDSFSLANLQLLWFSEIRKSNFGNFIRYYKCLSNKVNPYEIASLLLSSKFYVIF